MAKPLNDAWNQHLDELNRNDYSRSLKVSLVRIEKPIEVALDHIEHVHPYWQLSVMLKKSYSVDFEQFSLSPEAGDILIIPPQNWHHCNFMNGKNDWTVKFILEESDEKFEPGIIKNNPEIQFLSKCLREVMVDEKNRTKSRTILIEHLISAVLDLHFLNRDIQGDAINLIKKIRILIDEQLQKGIVPKVENISAELGFSAPYVTRVYKKQLGIPLKVYIDQQRFAMAKKLLIYSGLNIGEIAEEMGFDDVFRFSRFFKRMSGDSPRQYLKNNIGW